MPASTATHGTWGCLSTAGSARVRPVYPQAPTLILPSLVPDAAATATALIPARSACPFNARDDADGPEQCAAQLAGSASGVLAQQLGGQEKNNRATSEPKILKI